MSDSGDRVSLSRGAETVTDSGPANRAWSALRLMDDMGGARTASRSLDDLSSSLCASITSGESRKRGKVGVHGDDGTAKPTLARTTKRAERSQRGEEEGRKTKRKAAETPRWAKARSSGFRLVAGGGVQRL